MRRVGARCDSVAVEWILLVVPASESAVLAAVLGVLELLPIACCCKAILLCKCWIGEEVLRGDHVLARETYVGSLWI